MIDDHISGQKNVGIEVVSIKGFDNHLFIQQLISEQIAELLYLLKM